MRVEPLWQTAPDALTLPCGEVQVWRACLDVDAEVLERWRETLSAEEQARARRFHSPADRDRYTAGRGILRALLARYLGTSAGDFRFCLNAHGKPGLAPGDGNADLRFNVSHSHGLALFAFTWGREVGVDLELVWPTLRDDLLAERFFSAQEVAALRALPEGAGKEAFFHCWTRKEAYIKARGAGLSINLASFAVSLIPDPVGHLPITGNDGAEGGRWWLRALAPGGGYVGAVAAEGEDWPLTLWQWPSPGGSM
ncbi:MAG TPA: 4'-phosphopantetheinyl transferase superfamily protein [Terriglobia bacterium]|nr:4'-phosphopantetheinyl transferase superfamily protein [Terriglobia bacterium]